MVVASSNGGGLWPAPLICVPFGVKWQGEAAMSEIVEEMKKQEGQPTYSSEPYAPPGLDDPVARQSRRLGWKVYAFLLVGSFFAGYIYLFLADFQAFVVPDCIMSGFGLAGLFGYAFRRRLLHARVWVICALILPVWDLISNFVYEVSAAGTAFAIAVLLPKYVALWRYGHSSEIWEAEATEPGTEKWLERHPPNPSPAADRWRVR